MPLLLNCLSNILYSHFKWILIFIQWLNWSISILMKLLTLFHFVGIQPDINSSPHSIDPFSYFCFFMQYSLESKNILWKIKIAKYIVLINKNKNKVKTHSPCTLLFLEGTWVLFSCPWLKESSVKVASNCCYLQIGGSMVSTSCCLTSPSPSSEGPVSCSTHWRTRRHTLSTCLLTGAASFWQASLLLSDLEEYCVLEHQGMVHFRMFFLQHYTLTDIFMKLVCTVCRVRPEALDVKRKWEVWSLKEFAAHIPFERSLDVAWTLSDLRLNFFMLDFSVKFCPLNSICQTKQGQILCSVSWKYLSGEKSNGFCLLIDGGICSFLLTLLSLLASGYTSRSDWQHQVRSPTQKAFYWILIFGRFII